MPPETQSDATVIAQSYHAIRAGRAGIRAGASSRRAKCPGHVRRLVTFTLALLASCATLHGHWVDPHSVTVLPARWPQPARAALADQPRIEALWMNETTVRTGIVWGGKLVTSTNVTSVEIRTESFTFVAQRLRPGVFTFSEDILDMVPQYRRAYTLQVIARNPAGAKDTWLVPIVIA